MTAHLSGGTPRVFVHVGEPKTGTTFLQQVLWTNKDELGKQGLLVPGPRPMAHWRAAQDLRQVPQIPNDPVGPNKGGWDRLVRQALRAPRVGVISHELLAAASAAQAERGIRSLAGAEVHVVLTVRDLGSLLPAEWQETVKHRNTRDWEGWLSDVIDREAVAGDRRRYWFWKVHDTLEILRIWSTLVPHERVHVITMPPRGAGADLLWRRFADVVGVDPDAVDLDRARSNASLGLAEVELLRRINVALPSEIPNWFYMRNVKDALAHGALADRPTALGRLELPPERAVWAKEQAEHLVGALRDSDYDVVGDLAELLPSGATGSVASPSDARAEDMLDSAVAAVTALLVEVGRTQGIGRSLSPASAARDDDATAPDAGHGRVKAALIRMGERNRTVHRIRRGYWHVANAVRHLRSTARPGPSAGDGRIR